MVKAVVIRTDNMMSIVELNSWDLQEKEEAIGAGCIEAITPKYVTFYDKPLVFFVDDDGHAKGLPINMAGSILYGTTVHGHPIVGDILFGYKNGPDILPIEEPEELAEQLKNIFPFLREEKRAQI